MLIEFLRIARESKAEFIMKVDCDMVIRNLDRFLQPLQENANSVIGFKLNPRMNYAAGVTYILPSQGLYNAIRSFYSWYEEERVSSKEWAAHCPEDWAITRSVAALNNYTLLQWENSINPHTWLLAPFCYSELNDDGSINPVCLSRYTIYDFVNFGNRHELEHRTELLKNHTQREVAAHCMQKFVEFDLDNIFTANLQ